MNKLVNNAVLRCQTQLRATKSLPTKLTWCQLTDKNMNLILVSCRYFSGCLLDDTEAKSYLKFEVTDSGPQLTQEEHYANLRPLTNMR